MIWMFLAIAAAVLAFFWLTRFGAQRPRHYADAQPPLDLRTALSGPILCSGVIYGPLGRVVSRFDGQFHAEWQGDTCTLREDYTFDTGATQSRVWTLTLSDSHLSGSAADVEGVAEGRVAGASATMRYRLRLPDSAGGHLIRVIDWLHAAPGGAIVNQSRFYKFGVPVGGLIATMTPRSE